MRRTGWLQGHSRKSRDQWTKAPLQQTLPLSFLLMHPARVITHCLLCPVPALLPPHRLSLRLHTPHIRFFFLSPTKQPPQVLVKVMPMPLFRGYSAAIRGLNNIVGGISFVTIARLFGVQKSGSAATPALAEA